MEILSYIFKIERFLLRNKQQSLLFVMIRNNMILQTNDILFDELF